MRVQFQLTFDDYVEASEASIVAVAKPRRSLSLLVLTWQFTTLAIVAFLINRFDPWQATTDRTHFVLALLVIPMIPWVMVLCYLLWFTSQSTRLAAMAPAPWMAPSQHGSKPARKRPNMKVLRASFLTLTMAVFFCYEALKWNPPGPFEAPAVIEFSYTVTFLPWGVYMLWAALTKIITAKNQFRAAWEKQIQLHRAVTMEFSMDAIVHETVASHTIFKWDYFPGCRETVNLFIFYGSPLYFYMVPKRGFGSLRELAEFRNLILDKFGPRISAFPVIPIAPTPVLAVAPDSTVENETQA